MAFTIGANLPWVRYGCDIGANAWFPSGGLAANSREDLPALFDRLRDGGVELIRWFFFCDLRAGVRFDDDGVPEALDHTVERDIDAALTLVGRSGLRLVPVLFDFHLCRPRRRLRGVEMGGRSRLLRVPAFRARLVETMVAPVVRRYGHEPLIAAWDLFNEPEWATFGVGTWNPVASVPRAAMRAFLGETARLVRDAARQPITVGSASLATINLVRGLGLDFYQPHWYDRFERVAPLARSLSEIGYDRPVVLGEFPTGRSTRDPATLVRTARGAGFAGAWFWSVLATDRFTAPDALDQLPSWQLTNA
ncbi:MAG TPA: hypothetical protein VF198_07325 [Vicinamibacterales bacterium]